MRPWSETELMFNKGISKRIICIGCGKKNWMSLGCEERECEMVKCI